jgi:hypothetical protein
MPRRASSISVNEPLTPHNRNAAKEPAYRSFASRLSNEKAAAAGENSDGFFRIVSPRKDPLTLPTDG